MKKSVKIAILILCICAIILAVFLLSKPSEKPVIELVRDVPQTTEQEVNYAPPTQEEADVGDIRKQEIEVEASTEAELTDDASVSIVDASQYGNEIEVRAFVSNLLADGTCTAVFKRGDAIVTREVSAFADATTTPCINIVVPRSEFPEAGQWDVTVTYENDTRTGSSSSIINIE